VRNSGKGSRSRAQVPLWREKALAAMGIRSKKKRTETNKGMPLPSLSVISSAIL